ncbi:MAG: chromate resistance protein [Candidimonas sp.]|nr:MAG: chromate resistance protein [Candidimonas sp.]
MEWLALILSLPANSATTRTRTWRELKALGAGTLRDGVYLLPARPEFRSALEAIEAGVAVAGGSAQIVRIVSEGPQQERAHVKLFDRAEAFGELGERISQASRALKAESEAAAMRTLRRLQKSFEDICRTDFFPGPAQQRARKNLDRLQRAITLQFSPDEPTMSEGLIERLDSADFQRKTWATRKRPGIDRLASAWLIRRFIDPASKLVWLAKPADAPALAIGYDFDGAQFTHRGERVTFEVLMASFGLEEDWALTYVGRIVRFLDIGGEAPAEAAGVGALFDGMRSLHQNDDELVVAALGAFDGLYQAFKIGEKADG